MAPAPSAPRRCAQLSTDDPRLLEGARLFNAGDFFACHEVWESLWHALHGKERELLQGLIQAAVAYYHMIRGNRTGTRYLFQRAVLRLRGWGVQHAGIDVAHLLAQLERDGADVEAGLRVLRRPWIRVGTDVRNAMGSHACV